MRFFEAVCDLAFLVGIANLYDRIVRGELVIDGIEHKSGTTTLFEGHKPIIKYRASDSEHTIITLCSLHITRTNQHAAISQLFESILSKARSGIDI